ncbi:MAG: leucine-rich repeat domain-containing protein [Duncaniella sp.]|nr:leucine-rich repeat domain-containing protein [Duncaniella sp.]
MKKILLCCTMLVGIVNAYAIDIEPITITIPVPGQLEETLLYCDHSRIEHLILKGTLNGTDLKLINKPTGVLLTVETLDLSGINCVEDTEVPYATVQDPENTKLFRFYYSPREEVIRGSDDPNWMVSGTDKFSCFTTSLCGLLSGESIPYKEVIMPHVAYPGDLAATDNKNITKIEYSSATNRIGYGAFYNCSHLSEINIPDKSSISEIGDYAFKYSVYNDFSSIKPTTVGVRAFEGNTVTTIDLSSLTSLGKGAFYESQLTGIINLDKLENIPASAFQYSRISDVLFSEKLNNIGESAFSNTPYLREELNTRGYENGVFYLNGFAYQADKVSVTNDVVIN